MGFAITAPGLEMLTASEVAALGLSPRPVAGGVEFETDASGLARANLELRTATRIVVRVAEFRATAFREVERHAARIAWDRFVPYGGGTHFRVTCRKSRLYHSDAVAERFQAAAQRAVGAVAALATPDDEPGVYDAQLFVVRVLHDVVTVSADTSGELLHLRGYRQALAKAPVRETLAAAMLLGVGWDGSVPLLDPLCGAGTIAIEGGLIARRIAPGLASADRVPRPFAFRRWPDQDEAAWSRVVDEARDTILPRARTAIVASDHDAGAVNAARANAARAGLAADVSITQSPFATAAIPAAPGWLVTNPPYGVRVGHNIGLAKLYAQLGTFARDRLAGWQLALLSADRGLDRHLALDLLERWHSSNGGIPVRLMTAAA